MFLVYFFLWQISILNLQASGGTENMQGNITDEITTNNRINLKDFFKTAKCTMKTSKELRYLKKGDKACFIDISQLENKKLAYQYIQKNWSKDNIHKTIYQKYPDASKRYIENKENKIIIYNRLGKNRLADNPLADKKTESEEEYLCKALEYSEDFDSRIPKKFLFFYGCSFNIEKKDFLEKYELKEEDTNTIDDFLKQNAFKNDIIDKINPGRERDFLGIFYPKKSIIWKENLSEDLFEIKIIYITRYKALAIRGLIRKGLENQGCTINQATQKKRIKERKILSNIDHLVRACSFSIQETRIQKGKALSAYLNEKYLNKILNKDPNKTKILNIVNSNLGKDIRKFDSNSIIFSYIDNLEKGIFSIYVLEKTKT